MTKLATERQIHFAVVDYCKAKNIPVIHIANEGKRSLWFGRTLKKMGMTKGVSDLFIMHPQGKKFGLWLELKAHGKKPTVEQYEWLDKVIELGYFGAWSDSVDGAIEIIQEYIK